MRELNCFGVKNFNREELVQYTLSSSSKGNQEKFLTKDNKYFVKTPFQYQNVQWKDCLVELLAEELISGLHITTHTIGQKECTVAGISGICVYSKNFSNEDMDFLTLKRLLDREDEQYPINAFTDYKFNFIAEQFRRIEVDAEQYLYDMLLVDTLIGNEDRHLNNIGVAQTKEGYKVAPLFDFGLGLFEHDRRYIGVTLEQAIDKMECKPFSTNPIANANWLLRNYPQRKQLQGIQVVLSKRLVPNNLAKEYLDYMLPMFGIEVQYV